LKYLRHFWDALKLMLRRDLRVIAGGIAFFFMLSLVPLASLAVWIIGLLITPEQAERLLSEESSILPATYGEYLRGQISHARTAFSWDWKIVLFGLLGVWSSLTATKVLITGLQDITDEPRLPGVLAFQGLSLLLTLFLILLVGLAFPLATLLDKYIMDLLYFPPVNVVWSTAFNVAVSGLALSAVYRFVLSGSVASYRTCLLGGLVGVGLWYIAGHLLSLYLTSGSLSSVYGTLAGIIFFLIWLYIAAMIILFGGAVARHVEPRTPGPNRSFILP